MATNSAPGDTAGPGSAPSPGDAAASGSTPNPGLGSLIAAHKRAAAAVIGVVVVLIAVSVLPAVLGSSSAALSDSTTCSEWAAASSDQRAGYAQLYLREHGWLTNAGQTTAAVRNAITQACVRGAYLGEADDLSVLGAVQKAF